MPELPEVETMRKILEPQITGQRILSVEVRNAKIIAYPEPEAFAAALTGQTVSGMGRRGKFLWLALDGGGRAVFHLRMTGLPLVAPTGFPMDKHTHLILNLSDGMQFRYEDQRRFGRFWYIRSDEQDTVTGLDKPGPEPDAPVLTAEYLKSKLVKRKKPIKEMLHDQSIVAGIGNIYSDEILFSACIYPEKLCSQLTDAEWERLAKAIPEIIAWGIEIEDMTPEEYLAGQGKEYRNAAHLKAYGRVKKPCVRCGACMEKITVGGRSSVFCPCCQKWE